jgi:hypothetical protein
MTATTTVTTLVLSLSFLLLLLLSHHDVGVVNGMPSFGTRIPNGEAVPCPPTESSVAGDDENGCTASGYCLGLGHLNCGGFQTEDAIVDEETNTRVVSLNPFGEDFREQGFAWTRTLCQMDSDGDGYTNGQELGDPCCTWKQGQIDDITMNSFDGFFPSHPGFPDDTPSLDIAIKCASSDGDEEDDGQTTSNTTTTNAVDEYYQPQETRSEWDIIIEPYAIPVDVVTTYVDFVFNLPESIPDLVHIVHGEVIISQPQHLHHFVLTGCTNRLEDDLQEGVPLDRPPNDCTIPLGGWAPGSSVFGNDKSDLSSGVAFGSAMGIKAVQLNIHYTDGVYEDPTLKTFKMAVDGIKIYYTADLREYTSVSKQIIYVPYGPSQLYIPPGVDRYFLARTCTVDTKCKDASDDALQMVAEFLGVGGDSGDDNDNDDDIGNENEDEDESAAAANSMFADISCQTVKPFCSMAEIGPYIQQLCPVSCGLCGTSDSDGVDGDAVEVNPRDPGSYRVTSINYHAHLLGSEMYATLFREQEEDIASASTSMTQKQADLSATAPTMMTMIAKDLKSREVWYYDDQASIGMDTEFMMPEIQAVSNEDNNVLMKGTEIKIGDKIQTTCVYNSSERTGKTEFGLSTYDEMCIISVHITFKTPSIIDNEIANTSFAADLNLRSFSCKVDDINHTSDVWQGILEQDEDPRIDTANFWSKDGNHSIETTNMCTFPVEDFILFDSFMTLESRNCPISEQQEIYGYNRNDICYGFLDNHGDDTIDTTKTIEIEFLIDTIAGYTCVGGLYDQKDSNESPLHVTKELCINPDEGGGDNYVPYTCSGVEDYLFGGYVANNPESFLTTDEEYLRVYWYQTTCCIINEIEIGNKDNEDSAAADNNVVNAQTNAADMEEEEEEASSATIIGVDRTSPAFMAVVVMLVTLIMTAN